MNYRGQGHTQRRHVLIVAVQSANMRDLLRLRGAACQLRDTFLDSDIGDCKPGLPDGQAMLYGRLTARDIEIQVQTAIGYAAREGATLVLAMLGHGFIPGSDPALYLMAWNSEEGVRGTAVDVGRLLVEAADNPGVDGIIGIIDTCNAAGAQPQASSLATGTRSGQARLSLLMASAVGQEAFDLTVSRKLADLLRAGLPRAGTNVCVADVSAELSSAIPEQNLVTSSYDGSQSDEPLWLAYNRHANAGERPVGTRGSAQLLDALKILCPERTFVGWWTAETLRDLADELGSLGPSPDLTRAQRIIDGLIVSHKTVSFLRSTMAGSLSTHVMRRALATLSSSPGAMLEHPAETVVVSEVDAVEAVALNYPRSEGSCRRRMARFVVRLAAEAGLDLSGPELRDWAASVRADVALNDALEAWQDQATARHLRLIVSLHYALAGDWPETLGAWLLYGDDFYQHQDFACTPDQSGVEEALIDAVDWAEELAGALEVTLRRIEVAVPTSKLLHWHPEETGSDYSPRLGVDYHVLTRWSQRLESVSYVRRINSNAKKRLREMASLTGAGRVNWLAAHQVAESDRLRNELQAGLYTRAIGLMDHPGGNASLLELLLIFTPIVLWPHVGSVNAEHLRRVDACWDLLPGEFLAAYRARWRAENQVDPIADLRAVWDDEQWLAFCASLQIEASPKIRSV